MLPLEPGQLRPQLPKEDSHLAQGAPHIGLNIFVLHMWHLLQSALLFSDEFVRQVASDAIEQADELELRRQQLAVCLSKLRNKDRELIQQRYSVGESGKSVAELLGRPINSVYQSLSRIRRTLLECVNRQTQAQATP